jgi:hypothetical protein
MVEESDVVLRWKRVGVLFAVGLEECRGASSSDKCTLSMSSLLQTGVWRPVSVDVGNDPRGSVAESNKPGNGNVRYEC